VGFCVFEKIRLPREVRLSTAWSPSFVGDFALLDRAGLRGAIAADGALVNSPLSVLPRTVGALRLARRQPQAGARWVARLSAFQLVCLLMRKTVQGRWSWSSDFVTVHLC